MKVKVKSGVLFHKWPQVTSRSVAFCHNVTGGRRTARQVPRLGLARAYAMQGDTAKARAAYEDFLTLWNDADPDIPILIAAKAEYAKLI